MDVYAAERYSIVLNANQTVGNYWIRAPAIGGNAASNPNCACFKSGFDIELTLWGRQLQPLARYPPL